MISKRFRRPSASAHRPRPPVASALVVGLASFLTGAATTAPAQEVRTSYLAGTNLPGRDYRSFTVESGGPGRCRTACIEEAHCQAWTYVLPGIQGPDGKCWLKDSVPAETDDDCCTSGVKTVTQPATADNRAGASGAGPDAARREGQAPLEAGYNLALAALGAKVTASSQYDDGPWATRNLIDGKIGERDSSGRDCYICGWSSASPFRGPQDIVIDLAGDAPAKLRAVVINTMAYRTRRHGCRRTSRSGRQKATMRGISN